jgi:hypothetical protein
MSRHPVIATTVDPIQMLEVFEYEPEYLSQYLDSIHYDTSQENLGSVSKEVAGKNWILTMELLQYLEHFYPTRGQLSDEGQFSGVRDKAAFVDV